MIGLGEACKLIQDRIGDTCRILYCYELLQSENKLHAGIWVLSV